MPLVENWNDTAMAQDREVRLATVLFADICGSTRLYQRFGDATARSIVSAGIDLIMAVVDEYGGRLVKTLGDEVMSVFADPNAAARAACEMQVRTTARQHDGIPIEIHIGMQHGPVLVEGADIFGDTVNAASYLCALATSGQILTAESTVGCLSDEWRASVRPVFFAVIKGSAAESAIHQVLWQADACVLTDVNMRRHNLAPVDDGAVLVMRTGTQIRIDPRRPEILLGRGEDCDIRVTDPYASNRHALLVLRRTHVHLVDLSTNGTFVRRVTGECAHVFRSELVLDGAGELSLGRAFDQPHVEAIRFRRDRRAMYRA